MVFFRKLAIIWSKFVDSTDVGIYIFTVLFIPFSCAILCNIASKDVFEKFECQNCDNDEQRQH